MTLVVGDIGFAGKSLVETPSIGGAVIAIPPEAKSYKYVRFEVYGAGAANVAISQSIRSSLMDNSRVALHHDDATGYIYFDINSDSSTATLTLTSNFAGAVTVIISGLN